MIASSVILDVVIASIVVVCIWIGKNRGLFRTLAELVSYLVAWVAASVLASAVSAAVAEWLRPWMTEKVQRIADDFISNVDLETGFSDMINTLPEGLAKLFRDAGLAEKMEDILLGSVHIDVGPYVEQTLQNIAYMISFIVLFIVVMIVLRLIIKALDLLTKLPVIHELNSIGGVLAGAAKGIVLVLVLLWLSKQTGLLITQEATANSYIVPYLQVVFPL